MKFSVIGATGKTGKLVVEQLVSLGHHVNILARSQASLDAAFPNPSALITSVVGDALDKDALKSILLDTEVCIVSLGGRAECRDICSRGQLAINEIIKSSCPSIKRVIVVTSLGVGSSYNDLNWFTWALVNSILRNAISDKNIQEDAVVKAFEKGSPDYVIVRPGGLTDEPETKEYRVAEHGLGGGMVSRADVAHFIVNKCIKGDEYCRKAIVIVK